MSNLFDLTGHVVVITGGAGLLGVEHAIAVASHGGTPVLVDISLEKLTSAEQRLKSLDLSCEIRAIDLAKRHDIDSLLLDLIETGLAPTDLINNLASNPPMSQSAGESVLNFENFPLESWELDMTLGLTTAMSCSQVFGGWFAKQGGGTILNISSDLGIISPDQRVYQDPALAESSWPVKPISYSASKFGMIGLTKYLATYWGEIPVRVNTIALGSVKSNQTPYLTKQLEDRIPLGRLAGPAEYQGLVVFMLSNASSYLTGSVVVADGGRSAW